MTLIFVNKIYNRLIESSIDEPIIAGQKTQFNVLVIIQELQLFQKFIETKTS